MRKTAAILVCAALAAVVVSVSGHAAEKDKDAGWVSLFDGKTLKGWTQRNGTATYKVEDGVITGTTAEGSPNSFLCTDKEYGDFELVFEVKCHDRLNSGVQIRSQTRGGPKGRVNGPQVEIESSPGQAGFIYGEATGRGWLSEEPKSDDQNVNRHSHFKNGEWNKYRVVAKGPRIQTWINGHKVADLTHEKIYESHPKGFIGLQVHSIGRGQGPFSVSWRNIKVRELGK